MADTSEKKSGVALPVIDTNIFFALNRTAVSAMTHLGADAMRNALSMNRQFLEFVQARLDEDVRFSEALSECKTPQEAFELAGGFYKTAFDQYSDEMRVLGEQTVTAASDAVRTAEEEVTKATKASAA